jgi:hypothetical protein
MRKATYEWVMKQKTPSKNYCSGGFFRIFVNRLSVERNHSLRLSKLKTDIYTGFWRDQKRTKNLELYPDSVFRYEPFSIFSVFTIPIPKESSVSIFGILKLAGAPFPKGRGGALTPFCTLCPPFEGQKEFPPNFQTKSSREIFKMCSRQIVQSKIPNCGILAKL